LYGGLLITLWLLYFGTQRNRRKPALLIATAWALFSVPLVPMLLGYRAIHERYGLHRAYAEILYFSARTHSWLETHDAVWLWHFVLPSGKDDLFPGLSALAITVT